jgi:TonB family protein
MPMGRQMASSAAMAVALHGFLVVAIVFTPQIFRGRYRPLPDLGPIMVSLEGSGGQRPGGPAAARPVAAPLPERPVPPAKAAPAPSPARPADDLAIPKPGKARPAAKTDDLRPDFGPVARQASPVPAAPARVGPQTAGSAPGAVASASEPGGGSGVDINLKTPGVSPDSLLYYFARIQDKVGTFWMPAASGDREVVVLVGIRLQHNGQVREITIERSSGDRGFDDAAIRALRQAMPLPPFPALVKEDSMNLILKFTNKGIGG